NLSRAVALILWAIFSLLWVVSPNNRQSISVGLFSMPVFCDTLSAGGDIRRKARGAFKNTQALTDSERRL
ncbi:hypothetical protein AM629_21640, partial [Photorhabdus heterorhabditis]